MPCTPAAVRGTSSPSALGRREGVWPALPFQAGSVCLGCGRRMRRAPPAQASTYPHGTVAHAPHALLFPACGDRERCPARGYLRPTHGCSSCHPGSAFGHSGEALRTLRVKHRLRGRRSSSCRGEAGSRGLCAGDLAGLPPASWSLQRRPAQHSGPCHRPSPPLSQAWTQPPWCLEGLSHRCSPQVRRGRSCSPSSAWPVGSDGPAHILLASPGGPPTCPGGNGSRSGFRPLRQHRGPGGRCAGQSPPLFWAYKRPPRRASHPAHGPAVGTVSRQG